MTMNNAEKASTRANTSSHKKRYNNNKKRSGNRFDNPNNNRHSKSKNGRQNIFQSYEKNMNKAKEVLSMGDYIDAQDYFQAAEHYSRLILESGGELKPKRNSQNQNGNAKAGNTQTTDTKATTTPASSPTKVVKNTQKTEGKTSTPTASKTAPAETTSRSKNSEARIIVSRSPHEKNGKIEDETLQAV